MLFADVFLKNGKFQMLNFMDCKIWTKVCYVSKNQILSHTDFPKTSDAIIGGQESIVNISLADSL